MEQLVSANDTKRADMATTFLQPLGLPSRKNCIDSSERGVKTGSIRDRVAGHMSHITMDSETQRLVPWLGLPMCPIQPWLQGQNQASAPVPQVLLDMHQLWESLLIRDSGLEIRGHQQDAKSLIQSLLPFL